MAETTANRVRRLLALLPLLNAQGRIPLASLASALGVDEQTVSSDLTVLSLCGADERDPSQLVGVYVEGDVAEVFAELPALGSPVRLTAPEARALIAALETIGLDPGSSLIRRLEAVAPGGPDGADLAATVRSAFAQGGQAAVIAALSAAAEHGAAARIRYVSPGGSESDRLVEPHAIYRWRDAWYLLALCRTASEQRTFRIDRITAVKMTSQRFERPGSTETPDSPLPRLESLPRATVRFDSDGPDLNDREWPGATFHRSDDGSVTASVPYAGTGWISRAVTAQLGRAMVVEPAAVRDAVASHAAGLLERLEHPPAAG